MLRESDVNEAVIRQAADELEIGVPIRAWRVEDGVLVLCLAYGGEVRWPLTGGGAAGSEKDLSNLQDLTNLPSPSAAPWRFVEGNRKAKRRPIPEGDLGRLRKQELQLMAHEWGFETVTLNAKKAEYVAALAWLRGDKDRGDKNRHRR